MAQMRMLFKKDQQRLIEIVELLPFKSSVNSVDLKEFISVNSLVSDYLKLDKAQMLEKGLGLTKNYIHPQNFEIQKQFLLTKTFDEYKDSILPYYQFIRTAQSMDYKWFLTYKFYLNEQFYMSFYHDIDDMLGLAPILRKYLGELMLSPEKYECFLSLTTMEKKVLRYIQDGLTNKEISDLLYISTHTVRTHRNRIWKKLGIKTQRETEPYLIFTDK